MSNPYQVENQPFAPFRQNLNAALLKVVQSSVGGHPNPTYPGMFWYDSANNLMYLRNKDNSAWILVGETTANYLGRAPIVNPDFQGVAQADNPANPAARTRELATTDWVNGNRYFGQFVRVGLSVPNAAQTVVQGYTTETNLGIGLEGTLIVSIPTPGIYTISIETAVTGASIGVFLTKLMYWNGANWTDLRLVNQLESPGGLSNPAFSNSITTIFGAGNERRIGIHYYQVSGGTVSVNTRVTATCLRAL